jgi:hypothetical protein
MIRILKQFAALVEQPIIHAPCIHPNSGQLLFVEVR